MPKWLKKILQILARVLDILKLKNCESCNDKLNWPRKITLWITGQTIDPYTFLKCKKCKNICFKCGDKPDKEHDLKVDCTKKP